MKETLTNSAWKMLWIGLFAVAMGYMESAVVVYLRTIYYPDGFSFPLRTLSPAIGITELIREFATLVMLLTIGIIAAKPFILRFAYFIYSFAIWDICYYIFLCLLIRWPSSLLEWDILFLIPVIWTGPVIAPVINSLTMILLAVSIIYADYRMGYSRITGREWIFLILGSLITIVAYTLDYIQFLVKTPSLSNISLSTSTYIPQNFSWWLFAAGEVLFLLVLAGFWRRILRLK